VQRGYFDLTVVKQVEVIDSLAKKLELFNGDLLFNEGGDRDKLGRGWVWRDEIDKCIHQNHVYRARLILSELIPELVSHYANEFGRDYFSRNATQSVNLASINKTQLSRLPIPIIPQTEQSIVLKSLNALLELADGMEKLQAKSKIALMQMDQSILASAFRGTLVPQNPRDEPASELLARIKAAKPPAPKRFSRKPIKKRAYNRRGTKFMKTLMEILASKVDWVSAQDAFALAGVADGSNTDAVEKLYEELRTNLSQIEIKRRGNEDWFRLKALDGGN